MTRPLRWLGVSAAAAVTLAVAVVVLSVLPSGVCGCSSFAPDPTNEPKAGVVIAVDASSLTDVRGFTIRTSGGSTYEFKLGALENATSFPPGHLREHMATSEPIRVWYRMEDGSPVAYRIEDAPN